MLQEIQTVAPLVWAWIVAHEGILIGLAGGATGLSVFAQTILHKLSDRFEKISPVKRKLWSFAIAQGLTAAAALAAQLSANVDFLQLYPRLATAVLFIHQIAVNPIYVNTVLPFLQFQASQTSVPVAPIEPVEAEATAPAGSIFVSQ